MRKAFFFRHYSGGFLTEYELWNRGIENMKEIALTLKRHLEPEDSVVSGSIGALGYYSGLHIYDRFGLVDRRVAMREPELLRSPGHDIKVSVGFLSLSRTDHPAVRKSGRAATGSRESRVSISAAHSINS